MDMDVDCMVPVAISATVSTMKTMNTDLPSVSMEYEETETCPVLITPWSGITATELCRRRSFKRMMVASSSAPNFYTIPKSSKTAAGVYWYLQSISDNVPSEKPVLHPNPTTKSYRTRSSQITSMGFNEDGELLATGDAGGQVAVYHRNSHYFKPTTSPTDRYQPLVAFDAHDQIFDVMSSSMGSSSVNQVKWVRNGKSRSADYLLSGGDKTIKLWKVEQKQKLQYDTDILNSTIKGHEYSSKMALTLPKVINKEWQVASSLRATYGTTYASYDFNSISTNSDQETFLSCDSVRVSLWNLERGDGKTDLVDLLCTDGVSCQPDSLQEVIMWAEFHPTSCNIFAYGNSHGLARVGDMRESSLCFKQAKVLDGSEANSMWTLSEYNEAINAIRHLKFSPSGRYLMTRKYLSLEIWDLNMESKPIETYDVQEYLRPHIDHVYDVYGRANDNFTCDWTFNERKVVTGCYNNCVRIVDRNTRNNRMYKLHEPNFHGFSGISPPLRPRKFTEMNPPLSKYKEILRKCIQVTVSHPKENLIGMTNCSSLFIYSTRAANKNKRKSSD